MTLTMDRKSRSASIATIFLLYLIVMPSKSFGRVTNHELVSKQLNESRQITVTLPVSYNENLGVSYPVLYVLDGVQQIPHTTGTAKSLYIYGEMPDLIIVGIDSINRTRDMTPRMLPGVEDSGKADAFLSFLNNELKPYINKRYRTNGYNMLAGHSFGGLLAVYSLIVDPNTFQARFAFSPSLRFLGPDLFDQFQTRVSKNIENNSYFYMNVGGEQARVLEAFREIKTFLEGASPKLNWNAVELPQETHFTTPMIGQFQAFRGLFKGWKLSLAV